MLKEVARYGKFKAREKPDEKTVDVVKTVDKPVSKPQSIAREPADVWNPWAIYDFNINFAEEVIEDGVDILEQDGE